MADKEQKKPDAAKKEDHKPSDGHGAAHAAAAGGGKLAILGKMPVLLAGVMIVEAAVLFVGLKMLGFGAQKEAVAAQLATEDEHAEGGDSHGESGGDHGEAKDDHGGGEKKDGAHATPKRDKKAPVEIQVVELRAPNKQSGRTFLYDISIYIVVKGEHVDKITKLMKDREALIRDRMRTIIAQGDPEKLGGGTEPGLETLRRQVKYQLDEIVGEGLIDEVLVPRCIPFRTDY